MHIGFEAKRFFTNYTGLGNYSRFVVSALSEFKPTNRYTLYSPKVKQHAEVDGIVANPNIAVVAPRGVYKLAKGLWRSWGIAAEPSLRDVSIFHGLSQELPIGLPGHIKTVVTVHDLIFLRFTKFYNPIDVAIYKAKVKSACARADKIIAISNQTAEDLVYFLKVKRTKIDVIHQGCHPNFKRKVDGIEKSSIREKYNLPPEFILTVGTIEERKNIGLLIKSLALLPKADRLPVVIVGRATAYKEKIIELAKERNVLQEIIFLHGAAFYDFPAIYQLAKIFVYPSLFEGFGIPLVEAIESGIPVITSTGSCFQEAAGPNSIYIDPKREDELASAISNVLSNNPLRNSMVTESSHYIEKFQPQIIANNLQQLYTSLLKAES